MENKTLLKRILITYLCVMVIPLLISFVANEYTISKNNKKMLSVLEESIYNDAEDISQSLIKIETTIQSISLNPEFSDFFYNRGNKEKPSVIEMLRLSKILESYLFEDELIEDMFLYSKEHKMLVTEQHSYTNARLYFDNLYCVDGENAKDTLSRIENDINRYSMQQRNKENIKYPVLEYIQNVPLTYNSSNGKIVVIINVEKLYEKLTSFTDNSKGSFKVLYKDNVIYENGKQVNNGYVFKAEPRYGNFIYEVEIPKNFIRKENIVFKLVVWGINIFALLFGFMICLYFANKKVKAYEKIIIKMGLLSDEFTYAGKNEVALIDDFLSEMQKSKEESEKEYLKLQKIGNTYGVIHKLLVGFYLTNEDAENDIENNGLIFNGDKFSALMISFDERLNKSIDDVNIEMHIKEVVAENIKELIYVYLIDSHNIAIILSADSNKNDFETNIKNYISILSVELEYKFNIELCIGAGCVVYKPIEISDSMNEARKVIEYNKLYGKKEIYYSNDIPEGESSFCFTNDDVINTAKNMANGNVETICDMVQTIKKGVFSVELPTMKTLLNLYEYLEKVAFEINKQSDNDFEYIVGNKSIPEILEYMQKYVQLISTSNQMNSNGAVSTGKNDALHTSIVNYVNENFSSDMMSLDKLSSHFKLNPTYISSLFRKKTGETFLKYVENLRIEKACELIKTSDCKIATIARQVGYSDYSTFRRNFKKVTGITPTEYYKKVK